MSSETTETTATGGDVPNVDDTQIPMFDPPPPPPPPPNVVVEAEPPRASPKPKKKKKPKGRPAVSTGEPDVHPPPQEPESMPMFDGGAPDVAPPPPPSFAEEVKSDKRVSAKKAIDPAKFSKKAADMLDQGAQWLAAARYKDLTAPIPLGNGETAIVRIRDMAQTTEEERAEIADAIRDVVAEWGIELTTTQFLAFVAIYTYGKRAVAMEGLARSAQSSGTLGGVPAPAGGAK